ncbi:SRPBCC family protein [Mycolicibacterium brumae]|uniref:SRPBCC family protein n=1 Tax=Mycolicibacterium brumae TaxID=85968 RepID=A0A2G5PFW4_9MYCO|nr:SRPBCC family protein [Mycolicibacterium brumae]MCV7194410.1 SRPBCC family protein [Mycolicibacterium brumae]PIB77202.1 SRPBCC family protein [Mycolicibacterium brumae]RWA15439.1 hypothetical protein MBRU_10340 [Mycolicibacterium brumae DSM 44177]UWW10552.1 SRPBCC family protein [Mycolicibacterium brumae]
MTNPSTPSASASVDITADPKAVYALITDLRTLSALTAETTEMVWQKGDSVVPGSVFVGKNRNGWRRWATKCTVTRAVLGREFAFDVRAAGIPIARWSYQIEPTEAGCRLTESTWDRRPRWMVPVGGLLTGAKDRAAVNQTNIEATLERIKRRADAA